MHTKNLKPCFVTDEIEQFSEWDVRMAWDEALMGTTFSGPVGAAFHSYAFKEFLKKLREIKAARVKDGHEQTDNS